MNFAGRFPQTRMRRMRRDDFSRRLMRENRLTSDDLVYPCFVGEGSAWEDPIASLPGISRKSIDLLMHDAQHCVELGIPAMARSVSATFQGPRWPRDDPRARRRGS